MKTDSSTGHRADTHKNKSKSIPRTLNTCARGYEYRFKIELSNLIKNRKLHAVLPVYAYRPVPGVENKANYDDGSSISLNVR